MAQSNFVCCTVVGDNNWVIDGNVGGALIELAYGIAACLHDFIYKAVGLRDRTFRVVNKERLEASPAVSEIRSAGLRKRYDLKLFPPPSAKLKDVFAPVDIAF